MRRRAAATAAAATPSQITIGLHRQKEAEEQRRGYNVIQKVRKGRH